MRLMNLATLILMPCLLLLTARSVPGATDDPAAVDLAPLQFTVVKAEHAESVEGGGTRVGASPGFKLWIVMLAGSATAGSQITLGANACTATYRQNGNLALSSSKAVASSIAADVPYFWSVAKAGHLVTHGSQVIRKELYLRVAFVLPESVTEFRVLVPTLASGTAVVQ